MRVGDEIGMPAEPPAGTILGARNWSGEFTIEHVAEGWQITGTHRPVSWRTAFSTWGPASERGRPFQILQVP